MPYYEQYPGSHRLKLPLQERESNMQNDRHYRHVESPDKATQVALKDDHRRYPSHHEILPREMCPLCTGEPHGYKAYPNLVVEINGGYLEARGNADKWGLYKLAEDGQPSPWTGFPSSSIDELFQRTREDGEREVLIVLQSALDALAAAPEDRRKHYQELAARVAYPEDILDMVRVHHC